MKSASNELNPREVVHKVVKDDLGGLASCSSVGQMPRNRQQVKDLARNQTAAERKKNLSGNYDHDDPWYRILGESKKQASNKKTAFIRDVRVAPEPLCILATDRQLNDMRRFCSNPIEYRPFTVDPTFNIGKYNVTPITYQHLLLGNRRDGKHPSLIGPVLVHEKKTTETYSTFSGTLRTLEPELRDVMAFGTDDEQALIQGFRNNFDRSVHLLCELHLKKNIQKKLQDMGIVGEAKASIVADIFGKITGAVKESGLTEAQDEDKFQNMLHNLKEKWSMLHKNGAEFHKWFEDKKGKEFAMSVISPVRQRAGLGCPPERFTTNRSEHTNRMIQEFMKKDSNRKKSVDEFSFCISLAKLVNTQNQEVELAVARSGEFKIREKFKFLEVSPDKWGSMQDGQRIKALEKVHTVTLEQSSASSADRISNILNSNEEPLTQELVRGGVDWIPRALLSTMVNQAITLTTTPSAITNQSSDTFVVASSSDPRKPHIVNIFPNGKTDCSDCPGFKASSLCKHTIAVFSKLKRIDELIGWLARTKRGKRGINFSKVITHGMPEGRGKKGNLAPRKRGRESKTTTAMVIPRVSDSIPGPPVLIQTSIPPSTPSSNRLFSTSERLQLSPTRTQEHHQLIFNTPSRASSHQFQPSQSVSEIRPTGLTSQQLTRVMLQPPIFLPPVTCTVSNPSFNCPPQHRALHFPNQYLVSFWYTS